MPANFHTDFALEKIAFGFALLLAGGGGGGRMPAPLLAVLLPGALARHWPGAA